MKRLVKQVCLWGIAVVLLLGFLACEIPSQQTLEGTVAEVVRSDKYGAWNASAREDYSTIVLTNGDIYRTISLRMNPSARENLDLEVGVDYFLTLSEGKIAQAQKRER